MPSKAFPPRALLPFSWLCGLIASLPVTQSASFSAFFFYVPAVALWLRHLMPQRANAAHSFVATSFFTMLGFFTGIYHWFFAMYPLTFLGIESRTLAFFTVLLCDVGLAALQSALLLPIFLLFYGLATRAFYRRHPLCIPLLFALFYTLGELSQELFWFGTPWGTLALTQVSAPALLQTASLFGKAGISFSVILVNATLAYGLLLLLQRKPIKPKRRLVNAATLFVGAVVLWSSLTLTGTILLKTKQQESERASVRIALIQPDISGLEFVNYTDHEVFTVCAQLVREAKAAGAEVAVWTETIFVHPLDRGLMQDNIAKLATELSMPQYVGAYYEEWDADEKKRLYNALFYFDENGVLSETVYKKRRLVPFGEFLPYPAFVGHFFPPFAYFLRQSEFTKGEEPTVFQTEDGTAGALICFDSIYPTLARDSTLAGAEYFVLPTNDSWFLGSVALVQHEHHAVLRAVENGRYIARCAPTGISAFISDTGDILSELPSGKGFLIESVERETRLTLYTRVGNLPFFVLIVVMSCLPLLYFSLSDAPRKRKQS